MKKIILSLSIIFASLFIFTNVSALEIAKSGDDITVEGNYSSLRVIAGNKVDNKSTNDGLSFIAASDLLLEGESTYGFYAGRNVTVKEKINKDLFIAGSNITFNSSVIGRDLYLGGVKNIDEFIINMATINTLEDLSLDYFEPNFFNTLLKYGKCFTNLDALYIYPKFINYPNSAKYFTVLTIWDVYEFSLSYHATTCTIDFPSPKLITLV